MERIAIKEFAKSEGFVKIYPTVRQSINDFPYVTFIKPNPEEGKPAIAENIYFSKSASEGVKFGDNFIAIAGNYEIGHVTNAKGEARIKLCRKGEGVYVDIDDLL